MTEAAESILNAAITAGATRLDLRGAGLVEFPSQILKLADSLEFLDLSGNRLSSLPPEFHHLHRLKILFCSENEFTALPVVLGECPALEMVGFKSNQIESADESSLPPQLRWLILTDNRLASLPRSIGRCHRLQKLMLAGNRLSDLPDEMASCVNLELIRLAANPLRELPDWLFCLPKLGWLGVAGNPCWGAQDPQPIAGIQWADLAMGEILGQGASGVISRAIWQQTDTPGQPVAVKVFKGGMTSDGLPALEMTACLAAGNHPNLIRILGKVDGHPEDRMALVLELVEARFRSLAGPPDFDSCTRDVYPPDVGFPPAAALRLLFDTASVLRHLHERQLAHGDFYGHNLLHDGTGHCLLGDFGAASIYPVGVAFERIEVRAFGCLMEEIIERLEPADALCGLLELRDACLQADVEKRPGFEEILRRFEGLA